MFRAIEDILTNKFFLNVETLLIMISSMFVMFDTHCMDIVQWH